MTRAELLRRLQAADFAALDTALYLNTHPTDTKALAYFQKVKDEAMRLKEQYTAIFGPLTHADVTSETHWNWINEPWPWERGE